MMNESTKQSYINAGYKIFAYTHTFAETHPYLAGITFESVIPFVSKADFLYWAKTINSKNLDYTIAHTYE